MKERVDLDKLLSEMTFDEKVGQLTQIVPFYFNEDAATEITGPLGEHGLSKEQIWNTGSVLGVFNGDEMIALQMEYLEKSRLKIPMIFMFDVIHGFKTIFPIPLALGASWNMECIKTTARVSAKESVLSGIQVNFSPMADLVRDARWGRVIESTGEDPFYNGKCAEAFVRGYRENEKYNMAACIKHFAGYGQSESGRDYNTVDMSDRTLREFYLPAYKEAIKAGCELVMTSFNTIHGMPATGNKYLQKDILRDEWGFDGVLISDWGAVDELSKHGVAKDKSDMARLAIDATVDIEMMSTNYIHALKGLVEDGVVKESAIDECVLRVLKLKEKMGLFENPYGYTDQEEAAKVYLCDEHRKEARDVASKSMVLLKNDNVLPLSKENKIAVIGPFSDSKDILGAWSAVGEKEDSVTLAEGIKNKIQSSKVSFAKGCDVEGDDKSGFAEAVKCAEESDIILLALGESSLMSGEAHCRTEITLPKIQEELFEELTKLNKPIVVVLFNGRPLDIRAINQKASSILVAWHPGSEGGNAVSDVIFGDVNPSGKLTMSFPYSVGQIPIYYNYNNTGRPHTVGVTDNDYVSKYIDAPNTPLYPFGFGLSYTTFEYSGIKLNKNVMRAGEKLEVTIDVENTGNIDGVETIQLYIRDMVSSVVRPVKELKAFNQLEIKKHERKSVTFDITEEMLMFHNFKGEFVVEEGEFKIMVGPNSIDTHEVVFTYLK